MTKEMDMERKLSSNARERWKRTRARVKKARSV